MRLHVKLLISCLLTFTTTEAVIAQEIELAGGEIKARIKYQVPTTEVKSQGNTGTCWSFATTSFIETEAMRKGKDPMDISEMYFVRHTYPDKIENYVRLHGNTVLGQGGLAHDVANIVKEHGAVPESIYSGLKEGKNQHNHSKLFSALKETVTSHEGGLNNDFEKEYNAILDEQLGEAPTQFSHEGEEYTPQKFATDVLAFNADDYVEITSYAHKPYYEKFRLEIPDNWANGMYYNVKLEEMMDIMEASLKMGYSIVWDGDVSEKEFSHKNGIALVPVKAWGEKSESEKKATFNTFQEEKEITQTMRQETFDNYTTTDDHLMHIVGIITDENDRTYYITKNSWGEKSNDFGGYLYMSAAYVELKTVAIMVHKDILPKELKEKLAIQ